MGESQECLSAIQITVSNQGMLGFAQQRSYQLVIQ